MARSKCAALGFLVFISIVCVLTIVFSGEGEQTMKGDKWLHSLPEIDLEQNVSFETATFSLG